MKKTIPLSAEERGVLEKLDTDQLQFFSKLKDDKDFPVFKDTINLLIDLEKNQFFGDDESKYQEHVWQARHAFARGGVGKLVSLLRIIYASGDELNRRLKKKED